MKKISDNMRLVIVMLFVASWLFYGYLWMDNSVDIDLTKTIACLDSIFLMVIGVGMLHIKDDIDGIDKIITEVKGVLKECQDQTQH